MWRTNKVHDYRMSLTGKLYKTVGRFCPLSCQLIAISVNVNKGLIRHHRRFADVNITNRTKGVYTGSTPACSSIASQGARLFFINLIFIYYEKFKQQTKKKNRKCNFWAVHCLNNYINSFINPSNTQIMRTTNLIVINSRFNLFWFELVEVLDGRVIESYGNYRTAEEADQEKQTILQSIK